MEMALRLRPACRHLSGYLVVEANVKVSCTIEAILRSNVDKTVSETLSCFFDWMIDCRLKE
jgi:hypothetical protein